MLKFKDSGTEEIAMGRSGKAARRVLPATLHSLAAAKLDRLDAAPTLESLRVPPGNRLEALSGDRAGQHSVRINEKYRICFVWNNGEAVDVEITDYH